MNYNLISRRIVDRSIQNRKQGHKFAEYCVKTDGIDPFVLSEYIKRRSPKAKVMASLRDSRRLIIVVHTDFT